MKTKLNDRTKYSAPVGWPARYRVLFLAMLVLVSSCTPGHEAHNDTYTCPMHPTVQSSKPGTCPVCGMDLVRKARPGEAISISKELADLIVSPNESVVASIKTIKGEYKTLETTVEAQGIVTYDTRKLYAVPARVGGRIEKSYVKHAFQEIRRGQRIMDVYSEAIVTAQRELLYLLQQDPESPLVESAKQKLYLAGLSHQQVDAVIRRKEPSYTFSILSPYQGYVLPSGAVPPILTVSSTSPGQGMGGMTGGAAPAMATPASGLPQDTGDLLREGNYVAAGQTLFTIVTPKALRVELDVPQRYTLNKGDQITLDFGNGVQTAATIDFVQPFFSEGQDFTKVRVYSTHMKDLRIGQLVNATIKMESKEALWVPRQAVVDLGLSQVVFTKGQGVFTPRKVTTGTRTAEWVEIRSGLATSDEIAADAQFMVDSESFIQVNP